MTTSNPNIALVILDTLRKDAFDRHFEWLDGISYDNAWSTTHYSSAAHGSLFTGRFASEIGVYSQSPIFDCPDPALAELLRDKGYTTRGFSTNTYVSKYFHFDRGFEKFQNETRVVAGEDSVFNWPRFIKDHKTDGLRRYIDLLVEILESDAPLFRTLKQGAKIKLRDLDIIASNRSYEDGEKAVRYVNSTSFDPTGEFLLINLMDAHGPYEAPEGYRTVEAHHPDSMEATMAEEVDFSPENVQTAYEDCVRYLSDVYEQLFERLYDEFDYVITTSDHGESLGEHGVWGHTGLGPEVTRIPLSIATPNGDDLIKPTNEPVNLHDIFQTICYLSEAEPPDKTRGQSLTEAAEFHDRNKLLETHGLSNEKKRSLISNGYDEETLAPYDRPLYAIASKTGYAFETFESPMKHVGERIPDAKSKIESLVDELETVTDVNSVEIPEQVHRRLEELGYA